MGFYYKKKICIFPITWMVLVLLVGVISVVSVSAGNGLRLRTRNNSPNLNAAKPIPLYNHQNQINSTKEEAALLRSSSSSFSTNTNQRRRRRRAQSSAASSGSVSINIPAPAPAASSSSPQQEFISTTEFGNLPLYSCGSEGGSTGGSTPVLQALISSSLTPPTIAMARSGTTLGAVQRIAVRRSSGDVVCLLKQTGTDGKTLARSYNQGDWEARSTAQQEGVITPTTDLLSVESCRDDFCIINLPSTRTSSPTTVVEDTTATVARAAGEDVGYSEYELVSWQPYDTHSQQSRQDAAVQRQNEISRFLIQATFGPTRADIDNFPASYQAWLHDQMHVIPPSYTRVYFRERLGDVTEGQFPRGGDVPCRQGSRWTRFLFGFQDGIQDIRDGHGKLLGIEERGDYIIISVAGTVRGVFPKDSEWGTSPRRLRLREGPGYELCAVDGHGRQSVFKPLPDGCTARGRGLRLDKMDVIPPFPADLLPPASQMATITGKGCEWSPIEYVVNTRVLVTNATQGGNNCQCTPPTDPNPRVIFRQDPDTGDWYRFEDVIRKLENSLEHPHWNSCVSAPVNPINRQHCRVVKGTCTKKDGFVEDDTKLSLSCGSRGEVQTDNTKGIVFHDDGFGRPYDYDGSVNPSNQGMSKTIWTHTVLRGEDQLRQRMAWALSGIFVADLSSFVRNEPTLVYTDIFARHAFTTYLDVMREVTYSFAMADYLTYLNNGAYSVTGVLPDENYARELMQLFTIGVYKLHMNGTIVVDPTTGDPLETYTEDDIETMARVWTGFEIQDERPQRNGNYGDYIDGMKISPSKHDQFPKMNLDGGYIGDGYPLCYELPAQDYLKRGATYHFISAEEEEEPERTTAYAERVTIPEGSPLYEALCNREDPTKPCDFQSQVSLPTKVACEGVCDYPTVDYVQVGDATYQYVGSTPCVTFPFFNVGEEIKPQLSERQGFTKGFCVEPAWKVSCCGSKLRAAQWLGVECSPKIHIFSNGRISIAHEPKVALISHSDVSPGNLNLFGVAWEDAAEIKSQLPQPGQCAAMGCEEYDSETIYGESMKSCLCSVQEVRETVFSSLPSQDDILKKLPIGSPHASAFNRREYVVHSQQGDLTVFAKTSGVPYDADTIFCLDNLVGELEVKCFRNVVSMVNITTAPHLRFRNPPMFNNIVREGNLDVQGATNEVEAVLQYLVQHENAAPFVSFRLIQRFVTSNPSGGYLERVGQAFKSGRHGSFGTGKRGDLAATIAAVLLDVEARELVLDADPTQGQLREPLIKLIHVLRSLEYHNRRGGNLRFIHLDSYMEHIIGQFPFEPPSVFSYFRPDFARPNSVMQRQGLIAPETQVLDYTNLFQFLNYLPTATNAAFYESDVLRNASSWGLEKTADQLNTLLTGGRVPDDRLQLFQDLLTTTPWPPSSDTAWTGQFARLLQSFAMSAEFSISNMNKPMPTPIPQPRKQELPSPASGFRAVIFVDLNGGANTHNVLIPHSGCNGTDLYEHYKSKFRDIATEKSDLLQMDVPNGQQNCSKFGVIPAMPKLHQLYQDKDLLWVSNVGSITKPRSEGGFVRGGNSHRDMNVHLEHGWANALNDTGVLGRVADVLTDQNYKVKSWITNGWGATMAGSGGRSPSANIMRGETAPDIEGYYVDTMPVLEAGSSVFAQYLKHQVDLGRENAELINYALSLSDVDPNLFKSGDSLTSQMKMVARLVQQHEALEMDRGLFVTEIAGFDSHRGEHKSLPMLMGFVDKALGDFAAEMKRQGNFEKVAVVIRSEFGRSHGMNAMKGTNHGWNGNYFVMGGAVKGGQILGEYPVIGNAAPSHSWETIYNGLFEWMGVLPHQMSEAIPNGGNFHNLFSANDLMESK